MTTKHYNENGISTNNMIIHTYLSGTWRGALVGKVPWKSDVTKGGKSFNESSTPLMHNMRGQQDDLMDTKSGCRGYVERLKANFGGTGNLGHGRKKTRMACGLKQS